MKSRVLFFIPLLALLVCAAAGRSPAWRDLRNEVVREHPYCAVCGCEKRLEPHHIQPFNSKPELELVKTNLVVLCRSGGTGCHYWVGHNGVSWKHENTNIAQILVFRTGEMLYKQRQEHKGRK